MITTQMIQEDIESYSGYKIGVSTRRLDYILLRNIYFKLAREFTDSNLKNIGKLTASYNDTFSVTHASVLNGIKKFNADKHIYKMHYDLYLKLYYKYSNLELTDIEEKVVKSTHRRKDLNTLHSLQKK